MNQLTIEIPDKCLRSNGKIAQTLLTAAANQLYKAGKIPSKRAAKLAKLPHDQFLKQTGHNSDAPKVSPPPDQTNSLKGSRYLARVLWALSEGEKNSLTPMTASEIAKFITTHSDIHVQETNTARFFRDCRRKKRFEQYWTATKEGPRRAYQLSDQGKQLLADTPTPAKPRK